MLNRLKKWMAIARMFAPTVGRLPVSHLWFMLRQFRFERPHRFGGTTRVNSFFPPYPSEAFRRFVDLAITRRRAPGSTYLAVTGECPYTCEHCSYGGRPTATNETDVWLDVIRQVKSLGGYTIGFTGGEPLMRDDLPELVAAVKPEMASIVFTTGFGLDADRAARLADAGVDCVMVGVEFATAEKHDRTRGVEGSFDVARRAVEVCQAAGIYTAISTIGTREKIETDELSRIYELGQAWGVHEMRLLSPVPTGSGARCKGFALTEQEKAKLRRFHIERNRRGRGPVVAGFAHLESADLFGCGAGYHHLFIDARGNVCPCDLTPISFGSITVEPLADIWQRMGRYFSLPRCGCLMERLGEQVGRADSLPIDHELCELTEVTRREGDPLPGAYRRILNESHGRRNRGD